MPLGRFPTRAMSCSPATPCALACSPQRAPRAVPRSASPRMRACCSSSAGSLGARHHQRGHRSALKDDAARLRPTCTSCTSRAPRSSIASPRQLALTRRAGKALAPHGLHRTRWAETMAAADAIVSRARAPRRSPRSRRRPSPGAARAVPVRHRGPSDHERPRMRGSGRGVPRWPTPTSRGAQFTDYLKTLVEDETARRRMSAAAAAAKTRDAAAAASLM